MDRGQACRNIEESAWESGPLPVAELGPPSAVPESETRARRSEVDTMPVSDPFTGVSIGRSDWCVDVGPALLSMTTFELWSAIERSEVAAWMRVWREGMECWTPVQEVTELRWALENAAPVPMPEAPAAEHALTPAESTAEAKTIATVAAKSVAAPSATVPEVAEAPASRASEVTRERSRSRVSFVEPPLESTPAPMVTRPIAAAPEREWGGRWLAAGTAVAAIAILGAVLRVSDHRAPPVLAPRPGAPAAGETPAAVVPAAEPRPVEAKPATVRASMTQPVAASAPQGDGAVLADQPDPPRPVVHREERGQRRLPRGGRRADGR
jgi:hypothetical protein